MPRIWIIYCRFLSEDQEKITDSRKAFDRALMTLPITQHEKIWEIYLNWALNLKTIKTTKAIIKRYLKINPDYKENFVKFLLENEEYDHAAIIYKEVIISEYFYHYF